MTDGEIAAKLGDRLRAYRVSARGLSMTREKVARAAGVSVAAVERLENGGNPRLLTVIAVLREFGLLHELVNLVPDASQITPMEIVEGVRPGRRRAYAPRKRSAT